MVKEKNGQKLDEISFEIEKNIGHLNYLTKEQYRKLLEVERIIATDSKVYGVPIEEVIADFQRYGSQESNFIIKAFLENTVENTRVAVRTGRHDKVVHFSYGDNIYNDKIELALLSAHIPGSSGGGGWGLNGDRRLALAYKRNYRELIDPEEWLHNAKAFVYESHNGHLGYKTLKDPSATTIIRLAIENARRELSNKVK